MTLHLIDDKAATKSQRFRWQLKGRNGKIVAASSEGFGNKRDCATNVAQTAAELAKSVSHGDVFFEGESPIRTRQ